MNDQTSMMDAIKKASDELAYLDAPVEARVTRYGLNALRLMLAPDPTKPSPPPVLAPIYGVRLIVDESLPPKQIEFRDGDGKVTSSFELPIP